ncbi:DUF1707 SHOCT-like domain-containing protein [Halostreptopolyspora alba]
MSPDEASRRMRISDADRDRVASILREAAAEGRITLEELEERLELGYRARTYADLEPLTADLPVQRSATSSLSPTVPASVSRPGAEHPLYLSAKAGTITRRGKWRVPSRVEVSNPYGDTRLDFRHATLLNDLVEIDLVASWGDAKLVLPEGATAEINVDTSWFGSVDSRVPEIPAPPAPHFRITGKAKGGALKVRYRMRVEDWFDWNSI